VKITVPLSSTFSNVRSSLDPSRHHDKMNWQTPPHPKIHGTALNYDPDNVCAISSSQLSGRAWSWTLSSTLTVLFKMGILGWLKETLGSVSFDIVGDQVRCEAAVLAIVRIDR